MDGVPTSPLPILFAAGAKVNALSVAGATRAGLFQRLLDFDAWLLVKVRRLRAPGLTRLARTLSRAGDAKSWTLACVVMLATRTATSLWLGLRLGAATLLATILSQTLKRALNRARPTYTIEGFTALAENPDAFSFPSGHTTAAFAVAVAYIGAPVGLGPLSLLFAVGIGLSRVYLGAHYPLDVAAGAALGSLAGVAARLLLP
jgi:undecaprenyl-diphosphatase